MTKYRVDTSRRFLTIFAVIFFLYNSNVKNQHYLNLITYGRVCVLQQVNFWKRNCSTSFWVSSVVL